MWGILPFSFYSNIALYRNLPDLRLDLDNTYGGSVYAVRRKT